jgi:hypothetical protein
MRIMLLLNFCLLLTILFAPPAMAKDKPSGDNTAAQGLRVRVA